MNKEQALQIVSQALGLVKATMQEHEAIKQAYVYISKLEDVTPAIETPKVDN